MKERDYAFEALAEVTATDWKQGRGELNAALASIREQSEIEDSYLLADEIIARARLYRELMPDVMLTPSSLAKHWLRVYEEREQRKTKGTNRAADVVCQTCDGDRFVLVATRPVAPSQWATERGFAPPGDHSEEYAACPSCNGAADTSFFRHDGTKFIGMDPALARERMAG